MNALLLTTLLATASLAAPALAQTTTPPELPAWEQLTQAQRDEIIAPLRERWNNSPEDRPRMLERARRWHAMPPGERSRAHRGMHRWEDMSPAQRAQMRALFDRTRDMPKAQRRETMALFRAMVRMTPAERDALRRQWATLSADARQAWLREHAPRGNRKHR